MMTVMKIFFIMSSVDRIKSFVFFSILFHAYISKQNTIDHPLPYLYLPTAISLSIYLSVPLFLSLYLSISLSFYPSLSTSSVQSAVSFPFSKKRDNEREREMQDLYSKSGADRRGEERKRGMKRRGGEWRGWGINKQGF